MLTKHVPCRSARVLQTLQERGYVQAHEMRAGKGQRPGNLCIGGMSAFLSSRKDHVRTHTITCCFSSVKDFHIHDPI